MKVGLLKRLEKIMREVKSKRENYILWEKWAAAVDAEDWDAYSQIMPELRESNRNMSARKRG